MYSVSLEHLHTTQRRGPAASGTLPCCPVYLLCSTFLLGAMVHGRISSLSSTENRYLVLGRCTYTVLDEVCSLISGVLSCG